MSPSRSKVTTPLCLDHNVMYLMLMIITYQTLFVSILSSSMPRTYTGAWPWDGMVYVRWGSVVVLLM